MQNSRQLQKSNGFLYYFLYFASIFVLGLYLFHLQATAKISADLKAHLDFINPIISGQIKIPHEGFEYTVYVLYKGIVSILGRSTLKI